MSSTPIRAAAQAAARLLAVALLALAACGQQPAATPASGEQALIAAEVPTLNTYLAKSLEIDQLGSALGPDANLFVGPDPADGSASRQFPVGGPDVWIDWNDLGGAIADHVLYDWQAAGKDPSAFPHANECVGPAQVLSKMDLTYVAASNNTTYAYFGVQRADNNGDAGYYWLFTKLAPRLVTGQAPCAADEQRLLYDLRQGDVLLVGHFHPSAELPLLQVFQSIADADGVTAVNAINYKDAATWQLHPAGVAAAAVNTTITAPGALGANGVSKTALDGGNLKPEIFAEAAVPVSIFTGGSVCGTTFYGTIITRSSGSGGTSPDLKDLAGPALFNFGSASAKASLVPSCEQKFGYRLDAFTGMEGPVTPGSCAWYLDAEVVPFSTACTVGELFWQAAAVGTHAVKVTASDAFGCEATADAGQVNVYAPLGVTADLSPTCELSFGYSAAASGGSGGYGYAWTFAGGGTVTPASSTSASGTVAVGTGAVEYTGKVVVTDLRTDLPGVCTAEFTKATIPYAPIVLGLTVAPASQTCTDVVTYTATASGGDGAYAFTWTGCDSAVGAVCVVDPADAAMCKTGKVTVAVDDGSLLCAPPPGKEGSYSKVTTVTASVP